MCVSMVVYGAARVNRVVEPFYTVDMRRIKQQCNSVCSIFTPPLRRILCTGEIKKSTSDIAM